MKYFFVRSAAAICLLLVAFWSGIAGVMVSDRQLPVTVLSRRVLTPEVEPGGVLRIAYSIERSKACRTLAERLIIDADGTRHILPDLDFEALGNPGSDDFVSQVGVPINAAPGPAKFRAVTSYACNPVQRFIWPITVVAPDQNFVILKPKGSAALPPTLRERASRLAGELLPFDASAPVRTARYEEPWATGFR